jgi:hypothetical protein
MPNANNAKLVRIATRALGSHIATTTPLATGYNSFEVVVEARAGSVLGASAQPYSLAISALDITTGTNPHSEANNFSQQRLERFSASYGWPNKAATFTVTLNALMAVQGHLFRYYATLTSPNQIVSFVESPLFLLYLYRAEFGPVRSTLDTPINQIAMPPMEDIHERE